VKKAAMNLLSSPRNKLIAASGMLLALGAATTVSGLNAAAAARAVLGLVCVAGLAWWFLRARGTASPVEAPRLCVVSRVGLAGRTGLALVEVDGKSFLVVHGDGFAKVCRTTPKFKAALRSVA
jgi:hypothetical protein